MELSQRVVLSMVRKNVLGPQDGHNVITLCHEKGPELMLAVIIF